MPLPITAFNDKLLRATTVIWQMGWMHNSTGTKQSQAINFVVVDIAHYALILGMAWLQKQIPDIHWGTGVWHWHTHTKVEDRPIQLVSAGAYVTATRAEHTHSYELHFQELGLNPDRDTDRDVLMATGPELTVLESYRAFAQVVLEADSEPMPSHGLQDLAIELLDGKQPH